MKFVDKEIQEDFDSISEHRKQKFINDWLEREKQREENAKRSKIMFVKEWLEYKYNQQFANFNLLPLARQVAVLNWKYGMCSSTSPTHGIQFEIIDGKLTTKTVKISKD